jgi:hypothetical protein
MSKIIYTFLICLCFQFSFSQDYEALISSHAPQLIASNSPSLSSYKNGFPQEVNYISDNISSVRVVKKWDTVYISWNVCDDNTHSEFFVVKTQDDKHYPVAKIKNIPCTPGIPLLYSAVDNINTDKTSFYKLFKIQEDGTIVHIVTVLLPVFNEAIMRTEKNKTPNYGQSY